VANGGDPNAAEWDPYFKKGIDELMASTTKEKRERLNQEGCASTSSGRRLRGEENQ
jgi:hypothetical protein